MVAALLIVMMSVTSLRCSNPCRRQIKMVAALLIVMMSVTSLRCSNPCRRQIKMVAALLIYGNEEGSKIKTQIIS